MGHHGLAVLVPVLRRPHRVQPLLESIAAVTPDCRVIFVCDRADTEEIAAVEPFVGQPLVPTTLLEHDGNYAQKINAAFWHSREPLLFLAADDLHFHPGWLEAAEAHLSNTVGCVGTQDLCNSRTIAGQHATHFLMARWYAELGTIDGEPGPLCESYPHEMVDDEVVATAKHREAWAFAADSVVEHLHPAVGKAPMDDLYAAQAQRMRQGRRIFRRRERLWK